MQTDLERPDEYISNSTIDSPPREPKEGEEKQVELFDMKEHEEAVQEHILNNGPQTVDFVLSLTIKSHFGTASIKFDGEGLNANLFSYLLAKRLDSAYLKQQILGICGEQNVPEEKKQTEILTDSNPLIVEAEAAAAEDAAQETQEESPQYIEIEGQIIPVNSESQTTGDEKF